MLSPDKNKSLYGGDTLLRSVSLADDTLKIINRDPEKRKALQQVRRENLNTAIKLKKEAQDYYAGLEKDKNFKPTTDYQKALFSSQMKQQKWLNDDEQARIKMQQDQRDNLAMDSATASSGWGSALGFLEGLFADKIDYRGKSYTDSKGRDAKIELDGKNYFKTQEGKRTLASQEDIKESGMFESADQIAANMAKSNGYYFGQKTVQGVFNAANNLANDGLAALNSLLKLGGDNAKVLDNITRGNYKSVAEAWDDWSNVNSNSLESLKYSANIFVNSVEGAMSGFIIGAEGWQKNAEARKAENLLWKQKADKEQETWYKQNAKKNKGKGSGLGGVYDKVTTGLQGYIDNERDEFNTISNVASAIQQRAMDLEGRTKQSFAQKTKQVDKSLYTDPITGRQFTKEKVNDPNNEAGGLASAWDLKKLALNDDGSVQVDSQGQPIYIDKFSKWEAFKDSNSGAIFDKYFFGDVVLTEGIETLGDIGSTILFNKGVGLATKGARAASKGLSESIIKSEANAVARGIGLNANKFMVNQGEKLIDKVIGKVSKVTDKMGTGTTVGGKKIMSKFAPNMKETMQGIGGRLDSKVKDFSRNMLVAYMEGAGESDQIANDVRNKVMEEKVDKLSGIDTDKIAQKIMEENPSLDSPQAFLKAGIEANKQRSEWLEANPEEAKEVFGFAQLGQEVARATNNLGFITNLGQVSALLKNKTLSRTLRNNPYDAINPINLVRDISKGGMAAGGILKKTYNRELGAAMKQTMSTLNKVGKKTLGNEAIKQGFIEGVMEEGFLNTSAERAGLAAGRGQAYNLLDIFDNLDSELAENMYAGFIIGAGQSKASSAISGMNGGYKAYKDQQKQIKNIMARTPATKEEIDKFFNTSLSSTNLTETLDKVEELRSPYKSIVDDKTGEPRLVPKSKKELREDADAVDELNRDNFVSHLMAAATQGLSGEFDKVIDKSLEQEGLEPDDLVQLQEAKNLNQFISNTFDRFASTPGYDATALTLNRVQRRLLENTLEEVKGYKTGLVNALNERKDTRLMEEAEDMTQYTGRTSEVFDMHGNDHADLSTVADIELKTLAQNRSNVEVQVQRAMQTLDNTYDKLLSDGNLVYQSGKSLTYYQQQAVKKAVAQTQSLTELETLIQSNKELALEERKDVLDKREKLAKEAFVDSATKVPTDEEIEAQENPEVSEVKQKMAEGLEREAKEEDRIKPKKLSNRKKRRVNKSTHINKSKNNESVVGGEADIERRRKKELKNRFGNHVELISSKNNTVIQRNGLFLPNKENYSPQKVPTEKLFEEFDKINAKYDAELASLNSKKGSKVKSTDEDGEITELIDEALDIIDEINKEVEASGTGAMIEGYKLGDALAIEDAVADKDILEQLYRDGNMPIIENLERSGDGKLVATVKYSNDPEDIMSIELVDKEVLSTQKTTGDYKSYKIGQPIPQSSILEWTDGRTKMAKNYLQYGNPKITKLPDDKGNATVKFDGGPSAKVRLRRQTVEEIQIEDLNSKLAKVAEDVFGIPVGDKARIVNIIDGPIPDGLTNNSVVEIAAYFGPTDEVMVISENGNTYYIPMKPDSSKANLLLEEETWLDFSQREPTLMDDLDTAIKNIFKTNPEITAEDLLSLLEQNNIIEKNC